MGEFEHAGAAAMMRHLYACLMWLAQPLLRRKLRQRADAEPVYGHAVPERFGYYTHPAEVADVQTLAPLVWVHAVSLGETRAATVLIAQLRQQLPGMRLLLTHGTATGRTQGQALLMPNDVQVWQPWDTAGATARFLAHFRPRMGFLLETEVWPNLVAACVHADMPLYLVNARCNEKSFRQAKRLAWLARPAYQGLRAVWAQSAADAQRLTALGAQVLGVMGNFKFDMQPDAQQLRHAQALRTRCAKPIVLFASSREGEEAMLLDALRAQPTSAVQWLIVPRHPQRFDAVAALCAARGLQVARRSAMDLAHSLSAADVWIGDSVGEMALYFGLADVALLGGSFAPLGGQNLIEAAACGCPVIMGPHTFNFTEAAALAQQAGAATTVPDMATAVQTALAWTASGSILQAAKAAALQLGQAHRGAAQRTVQAVLADLGH